MDKHSKSWGFSMWRDFILKDTKAWDIVHTRLSGHPKLLDEAHDFKHFVACSICKGLFTSMEGHCCPHGCLLTWEDALNGDPQARKVFVHAWVKSMMWTPKGKGPLTLKGSRKRVQDGWLTDFKSALRENADSLVDEAILLFEHEKYPRAGLLALLAQEELIKMVWAALEVQNADSYPLYLFPIDGCPPGVRFQRLYLSLRGLRFRTIARGVERFIECDNEYDLLNHDAKLAIAKRPDNYFLRGHIPPILDLDHRGKYELLYEKVERLPELCRYVDIDFDGGTFTRPSAEMPRAQAFDHILFSAALCHDFTQLAYCDKAGKILELGAFEQFLERTSRRYNDFLEAHPDIHSQVFPTPQLSDEDRREIARREESSPT